MKPGSTPNMFDMFVADHANMMTFP